MLAIVMFWYRTGNNTSVQTGTAVQTVAAETKEEAMATIGHWLGDQLICVKVLGWV